MCNPGMKCECVNTTPSFAFFCSIVTLRATMRSEINTIICQCRQATLTGYTTLTAPVTAVTAVTAAHDSLTRYDLAIIASTRLALIFTMAPVVPALIQMVSG